MKYVMLTGLTICALLLVTAHGGNQRETGRVQVHFSGTPACSVAHVYLALSHVELSNDQGQSWQRLNVPSTSTRMDLLGRPGDARAQSLHQSLPVGRYQHLRLVLQEASAQAAMTHAVVFQGQGREHALELAHQAPSVHRITGALEVRPGASAELNIDFDACKSLAQAQQGEPYRLQPALRVLARAASGTISGHASPNALVLAQQNGQVVTRTLATPSGDFELPPLAPSQAGQHYDIVVQSADGRGTLIVPQVALQAGAHLKLAHLKPSLIASAR